MRISKLYTYVDNVTAYQYFQFLRFSVSLLIGIVLVKSEMPLEDVAQFELVLFLSNAISFFWGNGLKNGMLIYYPTLSPPQRHNALFSLFIFLILCVFTVSLIFYLLQDFILGNFINYDFTYVRLMLIYTILIVPATLVETYYILVQNNQGLIRYANILFLAKFIIIISILCVSVDLMFLLYGLVGWASLSSIWTCLVFIRLRPMTLDTKLIGGFFIVSIPLVFQVLVGSGIEFVDGFIINKYLDETSFLMYRYGARELPFIVMFISALKTVMIAQSVDNLEDTLTKVKQRTTSYMTWMFPLTILVILISPLIYPIVYSPELKSAAYLLNIYALIIVSRILLPQIVLYSKHKTRVLLGITCVEFIFNILLSLWLLNIYGIYGIAMATVISFLGAKFVIMTYNYLKYNISFTAYVDWKRLTLYAAYTMAAFIISLQY